MMKSATCYRCDVTMVRQPEPLDLSWAGDGPNADVEFHGILMEVHRCPSCGGVATRPVTINLPERARPTAAL
jgi:hypothetical protein